MRVVLSEGWSAPEEVVLFITTAYRQVGMPFGMSSLVGCATDLV